MRAPIFPNLDFKAGDPIYVPALTKVERQQLLDSLLERFTPAHHLFLQKDIEKFRSFLWKVDNNPSHGELLNFEDLFTTNSLSGFRSQVYSTIKLRISDKRFWRDKRTKYDTDKLTVWDYLVVHVAQKLSLEDFTDFLISGLLSAPALRKFNFRELFGDEKTCEMLHLLERKHYGMFITMLRFMIGEDDQQPSLRNREWFQLLLKYRLLNQINKDKLREYAFTFYDLSPGLDIDYVAQYITQKLQPCSEPPFVLEPFDAISAILNLSEIADIIHSELTEDEKDYVDNTVALLKKEVLRIVSLPDEEVGYAILDFQSQMGVFGSRSHRLTVAVIVNLILHLQSQHNSPDFDVPEQFTEIYYGLIFSMFRASPDAWLPLIYRAEPIAKNDYVLDAALERFPSDETLIVLLNNGLLSIFEERHTIMDEFEPTVLQKWLQGKTEHSWSEALSEALLNQGHGEFLSEDKTYVTWFKRKFDIAEDLPDAWVKQMIKDLGQKPGMSSASVL